MLAGPDRRERQNSFLEPLELEDLESRPHHEGDEDPDVFDRVTAVPGEFPDALPTIPAAAVAAAAVEAEDDTISGLFERATPVPGSAPPPRRPPSSDPPPVLSAPTSSAKRPNRHNSLPTRAA